MTKKSYARQQRDLAAKELKDNHCWDDLLNTNNLIKQLFTSHKSLLDLIDNSDIIKYVDDPVTLQTNRSILLRDIEIMQNEFNMIEMTHAGKTGGAADFDEQMIAVQISEKYVLFMTRHDSVLMPIVYHIAEQLREAEIKKYKTEGTAGADQIKRDFIESVNKVAKQEKAIQEIDPTIISDAVIKQ